VLSSSIADSAAVTLITKSGTNEFGALPKKYGQGFVVEVTTEAKRGNPAYWSSPMPWSFVPEFSTCPVRNFRLRSDDLDLVPGGDFRIHSYTKDWVSPGGLAHQLSDVVELAITGRLELLDIRESH